MTTRDQQNRCPECWGLTKANSLVCGECLDHEQAEQDELDQRHEDAVISEHRSQLI